MYKYTYVTTRYVPEVVSIVGGRLAKKISLFSKSYIFTAKYSGVKKIYNFRLLKSVGTCRLWFVKK